MSRVAELLREDASLYERKLQDYGVPGHPFFNFETSAAFAGAVSGKDLTPIDACLVLIGTKLSRIKSVGLHKDAANEPFKDSLRDGRVYLAILEAMLEEGD